ncbi:hypothetical protein [uncultured Bacteroides sp.]|uniref:hypothetical protein n=1 Tax=uncultured Bacteroides sp. TaxID=162156 RepID=UPI0026064922|nr:hypothetical protein [uncultured Bacteroides sp.]
MKRIALKPWQLYMLVFVLVFGINNLLRWISAGEEIKDGNLVVSLAFPVMLTLGFIAGDRVRRKNKKYKDKVEELLKNDE